MNRYSNGESFLSLRKNDKLIDFLVKFGLTKYQFVIFENYNMVLKPYEEKDIIM